MAYLIIGIAVTIAVLNLHFYVQRTRITPLLRERLEGRTEEQQKVIKYFFGRPGCFRRALTDAEFDRLVEKKYHDMNFRQKALDKIGIDESQVNEISPCNFVNYSFDNNERYTKCGNDGFFRSSTYQVTWLFFSDKQVYVYQYTYNLNDNNIKEITEEYFYKDIVNISTSTEINDKGITFDEFIITVPGDKLRCAMQDDSEAEDRIRAMKNKLREKKG